MTHVLPPVATQGEPGVLGLSVAAALGRATPTSPIHEHLTTPIREHPYAASDGRAGTLPPIPNSVDSDDIDWDPRAVLEREKPPERPARVVAAGPLTVADLMAASQAVPRGPRATPPASTVRPTRTAPGSSLAAWALSQGRGG